VHLQPIGCLTVWEGLSSRENKSSCVHKETTLSVVRLSMYRQVQGGGPRSRGGVRSFEVRPGSI
jgi:hypothetical protein